MNITYFTKGQRGSTCLSYILEKGYRVGAVIGVEQEDEIDQLADQYGFPVFLLDKINSPESISHLKKLDPDLFILCGYNKILKTPVIEIPPLGTINLHGGKLPEYRGAAPINWQIINGETSGGCSIIYVDEGIDTGDIIVQDRYPIKPDDTHASILNKTLEIFPRLLVQVLEQVETGTVQAQKQDPLAGGYFNRRYPEDSRIDWAEMTDVQVHNLVRGMHGPYQAAFSYRGEVKVEIDRTLLLEETITDIPGTVAHKRGNQVVIAAKNRGLVILDITVDGDKMEPAAFFETGDEFANEYHKEG